MPHYTFTFKKGDISVNFTTTDKYIVERQFQLWVQQASEYAATHPGKINEIKSEPKPEPKIDLKTEQKQQETQAQTPEKVKEEIKAAPEPQIAPETQETKVAEPEIIDSIPETSSEVFDKASSLLKTINSIQKEEENLTDIKEEPIKVSEIIEQKEETAPEEVTPQVDFESVLETKIENPTFEPVKTKDENFLAFIASKNTEDKFHYLILTAYYLLEYEQIGRFTLKLINSKLMQNLSEIVDHSILKAAIEQDLIELVPDLTGMAEVAEYRLTDKGEDFFHSQI